ncbi:hypothetical protein [Novosphingobium sp. KN65.2]|uniref:hypothetical protein n=1 Tax=Novosphingobium sp. KN65.2 TaxID=1478134 RepID=UPI0005DFE26E|nr:hypothetical protein [Novosphingobium sp. KN65.2]CDO37255.1 hypothetical protein SPHV1_310028 [Novosphingobium sp. KN65.2]
MTKRREPLTYQHTLTGVASLIGWDRCGAICGVSDRSVRNWSDPDCEIEIRMIDAERLDRAYIEHGGTYAPFHRLMSLRLELAVKEAAQADMARAAADAAKESGEAVAALIEASMSPDAETRRRARKEAEEAISSLTSALRAVDRQEALGG